VANRYWVGGTGSWAATTTNWSATSGGASGASVPTLADDVFFDTLSNATLYTVTLLTTPVCRSVTIGAPLTGAVTIAGSAAWSIYGSLSIAATGVTWTNTSAITFAATTTGFTITTNGVSLTNLITLNGAGGGWTLGSALTAGNFTVTQGTFATANFNLTTSGNFTSIGALTRSVTLGSSAISCLIWNCFAATNLTLNAGTSTITVTQAAGNFNGGGLTYYNVTKANNGFVINDGGNTFNALTNTTVTVAGTFFCQFAGNQTIGTLTINGASANARISIQTSVALIGTQVTLTVASFVTNGFIDFRDINLAGAASPLTVSTGGDCGNNSNITLATPKTVYWSLVGGGNWNVANSWATSSGGAPATANQPLPQDIAIIDDVGLTSGNTITVGQFNPNLGNIDASSRTLPMTLAWGANAPAIYGNLTLSSSVATTATTGSLTFSGYNKTQTITSATVSFANAFTVNNPTVTVTLADNLTTTSATAFSVLSGTLNLNGKTLASNLFSSTGALVRNITFGGGTINVSGATFTASGTNFSTSGTGTISMTRASSKTFAGGGYSYPTLNQGGAGALVITGANTFANITNTVQPSTITFPASTTTTLSNFIVNGTVGNLVTINSSVAGTQATLNYTGSSTIDVNFLNIQDSNATPDIATWYAGDTSVNVSNNNGWFFVVQPQAFDTHDGGGRKKDESERKRLAEKNKKRRAEIIAAFEYIVEGKPLIAEEIAEEFIITKATNDTPMVVNFDGMLGNLDRVNKIYSVMIDLDDEDVFLLL